MAEKKKEFKLRKDLEQLVGLSNQAKGLTERARKGVNIDLVDEAFGLCSVLNEGGISSIDPATLGPMSQYDLMRTIRAGYGHVRQKLEENIDDVTYANARKAYLGRLDLEVKVGFYLEMLKDGAVPNPPDGKASKEVKGTYAALVQAKKELELADKIEKAVESGDLSAARQEVVRYLDADTIDYLGVLGGYSGPAFTGAQKNVYTDIANIRRQNAAKLVSDKKLTGLIDKGIEKLGKAKALVGMYNAYQTQLQYDAMKERAKKSAKKAA